MTWLRMTVGALAVVLALGPASADAASFTVHRPLCIARHHHHHVTVRCLRR